LIIETRAGANFASNLVLPRGEAPGISSRWQEKKTQQQIYLQLNDH